MNARTDSIVIVGGGTSGWLSAAYLARRLGTNRPDGVKITLVEASDIPTVGVGEGTFPSLRTTMATIGVDEAEFMRESACSFKQGIKFIDWAAAPKGAGHSHYYHLFNFPRKMGGGIDLAPYWLLDGGDVPFAAAVSPQARLCDARRAPKRLTDQPYSGPFNYAYHFDAGRFAAYLKKVAVSLGVEHVIGKVSDVQVAETGHVTSLSLEDGGSLAADLFIDCSGFRGLIIDRTLQAARRSVGDMLFVDRAVVMQLPQDDSAPLASVTLSSAQEAGWLWDIGLSGRRGLGHVFSSAHMDDQTAERILRACAGPGSDRLETRFLDMPTGYSSEPWTGNVVAIGLAGGFLEPLEATGIAMIEAAVRLVADYFPRDGEMAPVARLFNRAMTERYENAVEFIKMHYFLSGRRDTDFWRDNTRPETAPDSLKEKLDLWKTRIPMATDFSSVHDMFRTESYQYVLFGMGHRPDLSGNLAAWPWRKEAQAEMAMIAAAGSKAEAGLADHAALLRDVVAKGFMPAAGARAAGGGQ